MNFILESYKLTVGGKKKTHREMETYYPLLGTKTEYVKEDWF